MKKIQITLIFFMQISAFSQNDNNTIWKSYFESKRIQIGLKHYDSIDFISAYRIWTDYQVVELIKINDTLYSGSLTNFVNQIKKNKKNKIESQRIKIPENTVKKLFNSLQIENIETLKDCSEIENYPKGFDGKTYVFEIGINKNKRIYSYWEPENEQYQNPNMPEIINVRNIINKINKEFNLWEYFVKFRDRLPKGNYSYGMINMNKN